LKKVLYFQKVFENQLHKLDPTGRTNLFACNFGKQRLVLIITSEIELEISKPLCKDFYWKKVWKKATKCTQVA